VRIVDRAIVTTLPQKKDPEAVPPPRVEPPQIPLTATALMGQKKARLEELREDAELLVRMEKLFGVKLAFRADLNYHVENFKVINAVTGEEYR